MEFRYSVLDKSGKRLSGITTADSAAALVEQLKKEGFVPVKVSQFTRSKGLLDRIKFPTSRKVGGMEIAVFTRQLATILDAGVLLTEALRTVADDMENAYLRGVIELVLADIAAGKSFSESLSFYPEVFSRIYVAVVKSGEEIGNLGSTLSGLAKYLEDYERMRQKFVNAMRYPLFLICFIVVVVSIIVLLLIPKFKSLFARAGVQLPLLTRIVVGFSEFWLKHIFVALGSVVLFWILVWYLLKNFRARFTIDYMVLKLPFLGRLFIKVTMSRFCRTFSILLSGGVRLVLALQVSNEVVTNLFFRQILEEIRERVIAGSPLSEAMRLNLAIPRVAVKMTAVGEKSGMLDEMLRRTADYYDQEIESVLNNLSAIIEPVFIIIIGIVVLIVALALYLPIFNLSAAVH